MDERTCTIEGCDHEGSLRRGMCSKHYNRWLRALDEPPVPPSAAERLWARVDRRGPDECWPWTGPVSAPTGYAHIQVGGLTVLVHRLAYELEVGPVPVGLVLDHTCHNGSGCPGGAPCLHRRCCNPAHLEAVTHGENSRRGEVGANHRAKTHCPAGHPYDEVNTMRRRNGSRACRKCRAVQQARWKANRTPLDPC